MTMTRESKMIPIILGEHREIIVGRSAMGRLLLISFTERGENIRIISERAATSRERRFYEEENH
jgi:uncharacterized protein